VSITVVASPESSLKKGHSKGAPATASSFIGWKNLPHTFPIDIIKRKEGGVLKSAFSWPTKKDAIVKGGKKVLVKESP